MIFFRDIYLQINEVLPPKSAKTKDRYKTININFKDKLYCYMIFLSCKNIWLQFEVNRIKLVELSCHKIFVDFGKKRARPYPRGGGKHVFVFIFVLVMSIYKKISLKESKLQKK